MWKLDGHVARLDNQHLQLTIDLRRPTAGIEHIVCHGLPFEAAIFQLNWYGPLADEPASIIDDAYVRGSDLIVTYHETSGQVWPQTLWRFIGSGDQTLAGIELWVSMRTELLDSDPRTVVATRLTRGEIRQLAEDSTDRWTTPSPALAQPPTVGSDAGQGAYLCRPAGHPQSLGILVHPTDFRPLAVVVAADGCTLECVLFTERLEKGVIRRCRMQALWCPRDRDQAALAMAYRDFAGSRPPLAT